MYINSKGKVIEGKKQGPRCQCRNQCFEKLTELEKDNIFTQFYGMEDKDVQDSYLGTLIDAKKISRRRKTTVTETKMYSYHYNIKFATKTIKVCRTAFCSLHAIHKSRVLRICQFRATGNLLEKDARGRHHNRSNKIPEELVAQVHDHIKKFPVRESHYSRNKDKNTFQLI